MRGNATKEGAKNEQNSGNVKEVNMSGYAMDFSQSNNALDAKREGKFPASTCARKLGVPVEFVRRHHSGEWHHTSKHYNCVNFFDLDHLREILETEEGQQELCEIKTTLAEKKQVAPEIIENATGQYLEWSGTRNHPKAHEVTFTGAKATKKGEWWTIEIPGQKAFRKNVNARGFEIRKAL